MRFSPSGRAGTMPAAAPPPPTVISPVPETRMCEFRDSFSNLDCLHYWERKGIRKKGTHGAVSGRVPAARHEVGGAAECDGSRPVRLEGNAPHGRNDSPKPVPAFRRRPGRLRAGEQPGADGVVSGAVDRRPGQGDGAVA